MRGLCPGSLKVQVTIRLVGRRREVITSILMIVGIFPTGYCIGRFLEWRYRRWRENYLADATRKLAENEILYMEEIVCELERLLLERDDLYGEEVRKGIGDGVIRFDSEGGFWIEDKI